MLTVNKRQPTPINFQICYAEDLVRTIPPESWQRLSTGAGTKGERYYEWARVKLSCRQPEGFSRWFLFRRCPEHPDDPNLSSYYQVFAPSDTSLKTMVGVAGQRWRIEECFQFAKDQLGLGDYEVRSWTGWHRHVTLVLAAGAFLSVLRYQAESLLKTLNSSIFFSSAQGWLPGCVQSGPWALVRLSPAELRRWVWRLLFPRSWSLDLIFHWSFWRRHHQALARYHHYRKRSQAP